MSFSDNLFNRDVRDFFPSREKREHALIRAAEDGDLAKVKKLVKKGVDVNCVDLDLDTPLYCAIWGKHYDVVSYLLDCNADPLFPNSYTHKSGLLAALKNGDEDLIEDVADRIDFSDPEERKKAYAVALQEGHYGLIKEALDHGASVEGHSHLGIPNVMTALYMAGDDKSKILDLMLEKGVDVNTTYDDKSLLALVIEKKVTPKLVETLIDKGADTENGFRHLDILAWTACYGSPETLEMIHKRFPERINKLEGGITPLEMAIRSGNSQNVSYLLENGADPHANGNAAYKMAKDEGSGEIKALIGEKVDRSIIQYQGEGWSVVDKTSIAHQRDVNIGDKKMVLTDVFNFVKGTCLTITQDRVEKMQSQSERDFINVNPVLVDNAWKKLCQLSGQPADTPRPDGGNHAVAKKPMPFKR